MSGISRSPGVVKGALVRMRIDSNPRPERIFAFQYNPESIERRFLAGNGAGWEQRLRLELLLDATDSLADPSAAPQAARRGIAPQLAVLESLLAAEPRERNSWFASVAGRFGSPSGSGPAVQTLLVWGQARVLPVRIRSLKVTEESFDPQLYPLRARIDLRLQVLPEESAPVSARVRAAAAGLVTGRPADR